MKTLTTLIAALLAVAVLGGCGSEAAEREPTAPGQRRAILTTIDALQSASRKGDARKICTQVFTRALAKSIRDASKRRCEEEVDETLTTPDAELSVQREIAIKGSRATAMVRERNGKTSTLSLVQEGDGWRIERITPLKREQPAQR